MRSRAKYKSERRQERRKKACFGMRVSGRSIMSVLLPAIAKRYGERETGRLEQRHEELSGAEEDRSEAVSPAQEVREQG